MPTGRLRLEGKVAVITGAGSSGPGLGTGKAASILFAREGARVLLVDRNPQAAEETLATIREEGGEASIIGADVTLAVDCQAIADAAVERYGALHILFNNVGITGPGSPTDVEESVWDNVLDVNLKSMMLTTKYAVPKMMDAGGGSIINMSSIAGVRAGSGAASVPYSASKAGVIGMSETMAVHLGRDNVRVNVIAPGHIYTPMVGGTMEPITRERRRKAGPLGVEGNAWDIAYAALFLASDESRWVSGVVLPVDAGLLAATPLAMYSRISEGE
ncbi:3-oxoacyl-[acyl-carrier-protein] reductase FabG [Geodia barretti]|uniref:3-oxoacyl-[acyl-carrier-protein] reductase FabG n=1 Tax=Geodia barretti TaxID=519541 RepID=A0AA35XDT0_GEOBA|nr:3-oxoacyl-[acyl-carrier-protein] reductase FabG [Geodia barretti]